MKLAAEQRGEPFSAGAFLGLLGEDRGRRLGGIRLLHVTDGAPADPTDVVANRTALRLHADAEWRCESCGREVEGKARQRLAEEARRETDLPQWF